MKFMRRLILQQISTIVLYPKINNDIAKISILCNILFQNNQVKVCFVDYGNIERLPLTCLQPLIKKFGKLSICAQACHLAKVRGVFIGFIIL
jgi:hypothetical protein